MQKTSTPTSPEEKADDQNASTEDRDSKKKRLIDDLAFLARTSDICHPAPMSPVDIH